MEISILFFLTLYASLSTQYSIDVVFLQNLLQDGRAGDSETEFGGEAGGQDEDFLLLLLHLHLQVNLDPHVQLQSSQRISHLGTEDYQEVSGGVVWYVVCSSVL